MEFPSAMAIFAICNAIFTRIQGNLENICLSLGFFRLGKESAESEGLMHTIVFCPFIDQWSVIGGLPANDVIFGPAVALTDIRVTGCGKGTPPLNDERTDGQLSASTKEEILKIS